MTKKIIKKIEDIAFAALLTALVVISGCATHPSPVTGAESTTTVEELKISGSDNRNTEESITVIQSQGQQKKAVAEDGATGDSSMVRTPFGLVKKNRNVDEEKKTTEAMPTANPSYDKRELTDSGWNKETPAAGKYRQKVVDNEKQGFTEAKSSQQGGIVFNFDNADLYEVIRTMADMLNINYIIESNVTGKVTIHTAGALKKSELFSVFSRILEANGLTAIKADSGSLYSIVKLKDAARMPIAVQAGRDVKDLPSGERIILQIISLNHMNAQQMSKLIIPFVSSEGTLLVHEESNTLLMVDKGDNIFKALRMVENFDIDVFQKSNHRYYPIEHIAVDEMVKLLTDVLSAYKTGFADEMKLIPVSRLNTLFAVSSSPSLFDKLESFIRQFDVPNDVVSKKIYVYSVKNGRADELSSLLNDVLGNEVQSRKTSQKDATITDEKSRLSGQSGSLSGQSNPFSGQSNLVSGTTRSVEKKSKASRSGSRDAGESSALSGTVRIIADEIRNMLLIEAIPNDYRAIEEILKKIDTLPRQVLIEVTVADITLDDSIDLGVEWTYLKGEGDLSTSLLNASIGEAGLTYTMGLANRWTQTLKTLAAEKKANVLSAPSVLASDNKEAKINISTEVPTASSEYQINSGTNGVLQTNIQYRNTGVILSVTPHINEGGLVSMEISQEVSEVGKGVVVAGKAYPSFNKRSVTTNLTVNHGQTIVIGGLISENKSKGGSGVPLLRDVPLLGFLFGAQNRSFVKTEMIVLITPRVISGLDDVDNITADFKRRVEGLKNKL